MDVILYPSKQLDRLLYIPASDATGLSVDKVKKSKSMAVTMVIYLPQIRYVFLLFVAIFLGFVMKHVLHPSRVSITLRHCYSLFVGLMFGLMCFGIMYVCLSVYM